MSKIKNVIIDILNEEKEKEKEKESIEKYIVNLEKLIERYKAIIKKNEALIKEKKNLISTLKVEIISIISEKICSTEIIREKLKDRDFLTLNHNDNKDME